MLQQRNCQQQMPQSQSDPTNPSPRQTAVGVLEPGRSRGRCLRASPTDRIDIDDVCSRLNRPRKPHDNQRVPSQRQLERYWFLSACYEEPLIVCVVQTVAKPSVNQPYVAPRKKAGSERQSETLVPREIIGRGDLRC